MSAGGFGFASGNPQGPPLSMPTSTLELSVSCKDLLDRDFFSKSDPFCILSIKKSGHWYEIGRTERLKDTLNPQWKTKFTVDYSFEERQEVKFDIYDADSSSRSLSEQDFLGKCETTLAAIVASKNKEFISVLKASGQGSKKSKNGKIFVWCEEMSASKEIVELQIWAEKLDKKDFLGKSDPYFTLAKATPSGDFTTVYKSEVIKNDLNPRWKSFKLKVTTLCNGDYQRRLKIVVYDWDSNGKHDVIGSIETNLDAIRVNQVETRPLPVINSDKKSHKRGYQNSGHFYVKQFKIDAQPSFIDYVQGGTALHFSLAIDFTASNGHPLDPNSLHFRNPTTGENQYTTAIRAVGDVVSDYDIDKQFPALGFGARVPPSGEVSHEFFLNFTNNPFCAGVDGLLQAYFYALQQVTLYGPTNFSPVINHVARIASSYQDGKNYFVLLILTDGIITDMEMTIAAIVRASVLPMSIIIVGVGNEDFSAMEALDCDKGFLRSGNEVASRDIVQFVELRKFLMPGSVWNKEMLAKQVLAEIPQQVVTWMTQHNFRPRTI